MATQADFSPEDWTKVFSAPFVAGMYISFSDVSNPVGLMQETGAVVSAVVETAKTSTNSVIQAIAAALQAKEKPVMPERQSDMAATQAAMIATIEGAVAAVAAKDADALAGYKQLIMDAATRAASAAKEGGFMGIGGTPVSDAEKAALAQLATILGVSQ